MKKQTVRSHYLPITYLKHFLNEDEFFMYKKGEKFFKDPAITPEERIIRIRGEEGLKNVGLQNNLYNPGVEGVSSNDLEEIFSGYGEESYNETIDKAEKLSIGEFIPQEIKENLCFIMASMRVRTPLFKWEVEQMDESMKKHLMAKQIGGMTSEEMVSRFKKDKGEDISLEIAQKVRDKFINKNYNLKYPNGYFIKIALMLLEQHADLFHQMVFTIHKSDSRFFITTDNPLAYFVPKEHINFYISPKSLVSPHCEVFFPLTNKLAVHATWIRGQEQILTANREIIDIYNYNLSHNSYEYIFSPIKMNSLNKFIENHIPYPFKITIY